MRRDDYRALVEQRNEAHGAATVLHEQAERDQRNLTEDEQRRWDKSMRDVHGSRRRSTRRACCSPPTRPRVRPRAAP